MNKDKWAGLDLKKGDRVRIVIEDVIEDKVYRSDSSYLDTEANFFDGRESQIVSIEKLKPALPTEPGTTFRARVTIKEKWGGEPYESTLFVRKNRQAGEVAYIPASSENLSFSDHDVENGSVTVEVLELT